MSEQSARLALPFLLPAQAQKHVTHNEALLRLDLLVQLVVEEFGALAPPGAAAEGQIWALGAAPSGDWAGRAGQLAARLDGGWQFIAPQEGWQAVRRGEARLRIHTGGDWAGTDMDNLPGLGVNALHDPGNRLAVASAASLFSHDGAGHQLKINKSAPAETASLLLQSGWSGRAELGLAGSDDLSLKLSPDGSSWITVLSAAAADGIVRLPQGARIAGHAALHRGNMVGAASQSAGVPTGAVIERGATSGGDYLRLADGSQLCWTRLNLGPGTFAGAGSFENPYRTNTAGWVFPAAFSAPPVISGRATIQSSNGHDRRMILSSQTVTTTDLEAIQAFRVSGGTGSADCFAELIALGRWF